MGAVQRERLVDGGVAKHAEGLLLPFHRERAHTLNVLIVYFFKEEEVIACFESEKYCFFLL